MYEWFLVYEFFDKETEPGVIERGKTGANVTKVLGQELYKPLIKKNQKKAVYARLKDIIWTADLAKMRSLSSKNRNVKCLLCVIDVFTKPTWVKSLTDKKAETVLNGFIEIINKTRSKPNKLWMDQEREFPIKLCKND